MANTSFTSRRSLLDARPEYEYQPLDPYRRQIRLFELAPAARRSDPVVGSIRLTYLTLSTNRDEEPRFDALSYVWGQQTPTFNIIMDGRRFHVGRNLMCALQDIRDRDEALVIWIDAICINQQDLREKGHQIQLMRYIYESASTVRVWMDEEIDPNSAPFRILKTLDAQGPSIGGGHVMNALGHHSWEFWRPIAKLSSMSTGPGYGSNRKCFSPISGCSISVTSTCTTSWCSCLRNTFERMY
jgi:hypothetical protein